MIDRVVQVNGKEIAIAQDLTLSHAGTVWDGALTMVYYWNKNTKIAQQLLKDKVCLELGSGTGIVGIAASIFDAKKVYLTDLPEYLGILQINKSKNESVGQNKECLQIRKLEWDNKTDITAIINIDTIIGSQLAYDKKSVIQLMNTIQHYKQTNPKLQVMIAYQKYLQEWKNLELKFNEYFKGMFSEVSWNDFDSDYRDQNIGILYMK